MNLTSLSKRAALAAALAASAATAHAANADIQVWAEVDPTLSLLRADGRPLPASMELPHAVQFGLAPVSEQVRIFTNDTDSNVEVRLATNAVLRPHLTAEGAKDVGLTVNLNGRAITTTATTFNATDLYVNSLEGRSIVMPLTIASSSRGPIEHAGRYEGMVSLVLTHPVTPPPVVDPPAEIGA